MIRHRGASAVLPFVGPLSDPDPEVLLIRQFRYAAGGYIYEVPAGLLDDADEDWDACARRELEEETGMLAGELIPLTRILTTPGFTDEVIHLYAATGLVPGETSRDADEFIELVRLPFSRAMEMVREGDIVDGKSVAAILYAAAFILSGHVESPRDSVEDVS